MSKIITRVLSVLLIVVMAFPNVAFASDQGNGQTEQYSEVISIQASETVGPDTKYPESLSKAAVYGAQRSPFRFRAAAFRSKTAAHFN